ncbi:hypothetical protein BH23DEI1_BH23DEI1_13900 [soil metagenome]|nr:hypothetical protein [Trueperaceae bacterium]
MLANALPTTLESLSAAPDDGELGWMWRAQRGDVQATPMVVVPTGVEAAFYQLNNLPERLRRVFDGVDLNDPDEDDLEELAPEAEALVRAHVLESEVIERLYELMAPLAERLVLRRSGGAGVEVQRGRPALLAMKRLWSDDWRAEALDRRLRGGLGLAPAAAPLALHDADLAPVSDAAASFGGEVERAWRDRAGRLARVVLRTP